MFYAERDEAMTDKELKILTASVKVTSTEHAYSLNAPDEFVNPEYLSTKNIIYRVDVNNEKNCKIVFQSAKGIVQVKYAVALIKNAIESKIKLNKNEAIDFFMEVVRPEYHDIIKQKVVIEMLSPKRIIGIDSNCNYALSS